MSWFEAMKLLIQPHETGTISAGRHHDDQHAVSSFANGFVPADRRLASPFVAWAAAESSSPLLTPSPTNPASDEADQAVAQFRADWTSVGEEPVSISRERRCGSGEGLADPVTGRTLHQDPRRLRAHRSQQGLVC